MTLYSKANSYPRPIPYRITLSDGRTRTDPATFDPQEILDAGYIAVDPQPSVNTANFEYIIWTGDSWQVRQNTAEEIAIITDRMIRECHNEITIERDKRIANGFVFQGYHYQSRSTDIENITGAGILAFIAIVTEGALPGNTKWDGTGNDFTWITGNNSIVSLDAYQVVQLGKTAALHKKRLIYKARTLKDSIISIGDIPQDIPNNDIWTV